MPPEDPATAKESGKRRSPRTVAIRLRTAFVAVLVLLLLGAAGGAWGFSRYGENLPGQTVDTVSEATPEVAVPEATPEPTATASAAKDPTTTATPSTTATPRATKEPTATPRATKEPTATPRATKEPTATPRATKEPTATPRATKEPTATPDPEASAESAAPKETGELVEPTDTSPTEIAAHGYIAVTDLGECGRFMFEPSEIPSDATIAVDETSGCPSVTSTHEGNGQAETYVLDLYEGQRLRIETLGLDDSTVSVTGPSGTVPLDREPDSGAGGDRGASGDRGAGGDRGGSDVLVEAHDGAGIYRLVVEDRGVGGEYRISFQDVSHGLVVPVSPVATDDDCAIVWLTPSAIPNDAEVSLDPETKCPIIAGVTRGRGDRDVYVLGLTERQTIDISTQGLNKSFVTITGPNDEVVLDREYEPGDLDLVLEAKAGNGGYVVMIEEEGNGDEYSITFVDDTDGATLGG